MMMEKEIKSYGKRNDTIIRFVKEDNAKLGNVYVLYPDEFEELQNKIKDLELQIAILKSKNTDLIEELKNTSNDINYNRLIKKLDSIEDRLDKIESNSIK